MITATAATNEDRHEVAHVTSIDQQGANNDVHVCVCVCNISESNPSHTDHSSCFNSTYNSTQLTTPKKEWFNKRKEAKKLIYIPDKQHQRTVMYNSSSAL